jgi:glucose/arabinose dehydrogenase/PKD repeat protein
MRVNFCSSTVGSALGGLLCALLLGVTVMPRSSVLYAADPVTVLPENFQIRTVVEGLRFPTDMVLLPSGDLLVVEKGAGLGTNGMADVRLVRQGKLQVVPVLSLSVTVLGDSGIYSIVLDPDFATNHYFYIWYSVGEQALAWPGHSVDRLSRFTYDPVAGQADVKGEEIILDGVRWSQWHNGGGLAFDVDGSLLVATGDAASNKLAQDMNSLNGKLLRIRPAEGGGNLPTDHAGMSQGYLQPEIYAAGLRNPFRMAWRPAEQALYLIDLGGDAWEEINRVEAGANYGWSVREGPCPYNVRDLNCAPAPPAYTDPVVAYPHPPTGGAGISALAFYAGTAWPEQYQDLLYFADFNGRALSMVNLDDPKTILPFGREVGHLVDLEATADGLYTLSIYEGAIRFIYYAEGGNLWPTAQLNAGPLQGAAPLTVEFSAVGSTDPEGDPLSYVWDFGDGSAPMTSTQPFVAHEYASDGDYVVSLQVFDAQGGRSESQRTTVRVYSGAMPSIQQEIVGDSLRGHYRGGDTVRYTVTRAGDTAGLDATTPYLWTVKQHHNQHVHFIITEFAGEAVEIAISDDSHAADVTIWYEAELTMLTDEGQQIRVARALAPDVVALDVQSSPPGATMRWNGVPQLGDQRIAAIVGQRFELEAPSLFYHARMKYGFTHWEISPQISPQISTEVGESARARASEPSSAHEIIKEPAFEVMVSPVAKSYVAHYTNLGPAHVSFLPSVMSANSPITANAAK